MGDWQERYIDRYYSSRADWRSGTAEFHALCESWIPRGARILEIGPGTSNPTSAHLSTHGELHGIDIDPDVRTNRYLRSASVLVGRDYPFDDGSFDACVSNYVLEHVADPESHLAEVERVLRPGGHYVFRTPNRYHYVALAARVTPHWVHEAVANRLRALPPDSHAPHKTYYRLNDGRQIRQQATKTGLQVRHLKHIEKEPSYGMASRILFFLFLGYERLVNSSDLLAGLRSNILCVLETAGGET